MILSECCRSVAAQTVPVVHAWESDDTLLGHGRMRDLLLARADTEWILPLDDNDLLDPNHVEIGLHNNTDADIVYSWCRVEGRDWVPNRLFNERALIRHNYIPVTALIRKDLAEQVGGFAVNNHWSLWLRALRAGAKFRCIPEVTWTMRLTDTLEFDCIQRQALQKPYELRRLIDLLRQYEIETVLEIGTFKGATLWLWSQLATDDAHLVSVDLPGGDFGGGYTVDEIPKLMTSTRAQQKLNLVRDDSHDPRTFDKVVKLLGGRQVDLLFIDGDHTYEGVRQDWEMYSPLVKQGGVVVFHDVAEHYEDNVEVDRLWAELKQRHRTVEFIDQSTGDYMNKHWGGLGVVFVT